MTSPFLINVEPLLKAPLRVVVDVAADELDLACEEFEFPGRVIGELTFDRTGRDVRCVGELGVASRTQCARCLRPVDFQLAATIDLAWLQREPAAKHADPPADQILAEYYTGETLDARDALRETLLAELPSLLRCSEQCKGLCPKCGEDRNLGPCACEAVAPPPSPGSPAKQDWKSALRSIQPKN